MRISKLISVCFSISLFSCVNPSIKEKTIRIDSNTTIIYCLKEDKILSEEKILKVDEDEISCYKEYYPNGVVAKIQYKFNNKPLGNEINFDERGQEREVKMVFSDGKTHFHLVLDKDGNVVKSEGIPIHVTRPGNPLKIKQIVRFIYGVVVTKNLTSKLKIQTVNPSGKEVYNKTFVDFFPDKKEAHIDVTAFKDTGMYKNILNITLENRSGAILSQGQIIDTIMVVE